MQNKKLRNKVAHGFFWTGLEQFGTKVFSMLFTFLLIRLLSPDEFGTLAIVMSFVLIAEVLVNSGLGIALVQKYLPTSEDENSIFYVNLLLAIIIYLILFFSAPFISRFYHNPDLIALIRVVSIIILLFSFAIVQEARLLRNMAFLLRFKINFIALIVSGLVGIGLAWAGFGVWALAFQQLSKSALTTIGLWVGIGWRPGIHCDFRSLREMLKFGINYMLAALLEKIFFASYPLLIGKFFSQRELGIFDRGKYYPQVLIGSVSDIFLKVMFPAFAQQQNDQGKLRLLFSKSNQLISFFIVPIAIGLALIAPSFVLIIMGKQWQSCTLLLQISCFVFIWMPFNMLCFHLITSCGHSGQRLAIALIQKVLELAILLCTLRWGIVMMTLGMALHALLSIFINVYPCRKLIGYRFRDIWFDLRNPILLSVIMGGAIWGVSLLFHPGMLLLLLQVVLGIVIYGGLAWVLRIPEFKYIITYLLSLKKTVN